MHTIDKKWTTPNEGSYKLNVDASISSTHASSYSVGMVLRDQTVTFLMDRIMRFVDSFTVFEVKTVSTNEVLSWILSMKLQNVTIESDSLLALQALDSKNINYLDVGNNW